MGIEHDVTQSTAVKWLLRVRKNYTEQFGTKTQQTVLEFVIRDVSQKNLPDMIKEVTEKGYAIRTIREDSGQAFRD